MLPSEVRAPRATPPGRRAPVGLLVLAGVLAAMLPVVLVAGVLVSVLGAGTADPRPASASSLAPAPAATDPPSPPTAAATTAPTETTQAPPPPGTAAALLLTVPVKGRAPRTGYDRDQFGPSWADTDRNGCDTRNDVLRRDLVEVVLKEGTNGCVVLSGRLVDPFSGSAILFSRGAGSADVQIDHVVALSDAWQKGAQQWSLGRRLAFGNDPLNLLAVDGTVNSAKGDGDAATWLPPPKSLPLRLRGTAGRGQGQVRGVGDAGRARRHRAGPRVLSGRGIARTGDAPVEADLPVATTPPKAAAPPPAPVPVPVARSAACPAPPVDALPAGCDAPTRTSASSPRPRSATSTARTCDGRRFTVLAPDPHGFDGDDDGVGCES